jgi:hypothetical protein
MFLSLIDNLFFGDGWKNIPLGDKQLLFPILLPISKVFFLFDLDPI